MWLDRAEADLIAAAQAGDRSAFAELLRPVYDMALRLAGALLQDGDEAEDAVQDAAFTAWRRMGNLREGSSLRPWFLGIVANRCRAVKRNKWWSVLHSEPPEAEAPATDLASSIDLRRALRRSIEAARRPPNGVERIVIVSVVAAVLAFEIWFFFFAHYTLAG